MTITPFVQALGILAVLLGWFVTNKQNNKRETRKEGRTACDAGKKYALEITIKGRKYLCARDAELAFEIKSELDLLELELSRIPYFGIGDNSSLMNKFILFSESLTGEDFEQKDASNLLPTDDRIQSIVRHRNQLMQEIEKQFKMQFC